MPSVGNALQFPPKRTFNRALCNAVADSTKSKTSPMELVWPSLEHLQSYKSALEKGWSADNLRAEAAQEELEKIARGSDGFLASLVDREALGAAVTLPDGSEVARLPGFRRWIWDGEFCGSIGFRWQRGTAKLPPHCLGHIGYSIVPWKRGRGYATQALRLLLPNAKDEGLEYVELTTDPNNIKSQRVIEANGGKLVERFVKPPQYGNVEGWRYRIDLQ